MARQILAARDEGVRIADPGIDDDDAYAIQDELSALRYARGEVRRGWKLGYTSAAMREQMGIARPNFGPLTDAMLVESGAVVNGLVQAKVEPEVAVVVGADGSFSYFAALEIVDSVWADYAFTWASNTADGSSATGVVLGPALATAEVEAVLTLDGEEVARGHSSAAMGHPDHAMAWLAEQLAERKDAWAPGDVIITGGLTRAQPIGPGMRAEARFGDVTVSVTRGV